MGEHETVTIITESRNLRALPFRPSEDQLSNGKAWEDWLEGIEREFRYFKITNALDKKDALIIYGGQEVARLEKSLPDPDGDLDVYQKLRKKLNDYYNPKRNKHYARYMFLKMRPEIGESTIAYATRLREKAHECDFGSNFDDRILEHLIQTIDNAFLIQKCISKAWTLQEFLSEASQMEDVANQVHDMKEHPHDSGYIARIGTHNTVRINKNSRTLNTGKNEEQMPICRYCGYPEIHLAIQDCPAYGKRCHKCQKRNHFAAVCKADMYREPAVERQRKRHQSGDTGKVKKTTENSDSADSSDDEFLTQSMAHMNIKKVQNISHSNDMSVGFIHGKQKATRWRYPKESEPYMRNNGQRNSRLEHGAEVAQLRLELDWQTKAIEKKFDQTIKTLIDEMNIMMRLRNCDADVGGHMAVWAQTAEVERNCRYKEKRETNNDNCKNNCDPTNKQQTDETKELQRYDWWENITPRTAAQNKAEKKGRTQLNQRVINGAEMKKIQEKQTRSPAFAPKRKT